MSDTIETQTSALAKAETELLGKVGFGPEEARAGTYVLVDQETEHATANDPDVEVMPIRDALKKYDWVQDLMFGLIDPEEDETVKQVAEMAHDPVGHFIWVREGAKVKLPIQSFCIIEMPQGRQFVHNVTLIDKNAEVEMVCGSAVPESVHSGHHVSISETYLREGAQCRSLSIEQWGAAMEVHSYARSHVGKGAHEAANNIQISPVKHHVCRSKTLIEADGRSNDQTVIFAAEGVNRVVDTEYHLLGEGANCESLARMVTAGGSITNKAMLIGEAAGSKGFLGCDGLKLNDDGEILSVPSLSARCAEAELSHEASVGMVSAEKMAYLMATGMTEDAARDLIIQGFLNLKEQAMPDNIRRAVEDMIAAAKSGSM